MLRLSVIPVGNACDLHASNRSITIRLIIIETDTIDRVICLTFRKQDLDFCDWSNGEATHEINAIHLGIDAIYIEIEAIFIATDAIASNMKDTFITPNGLIACI